MVKVIFLKDHNEYKTGYTADVEQGLANYWIAAGVAERLGTKEQERDYSTKEDKTASTRKKK